MSLNPYQQTLYAILRKTYGVSDNSAHLAIESNADYIADCHAEGLDLVQVADAVATEMDWNTEIKHIQALADECADAFERYQGAVKHLESITDFGLTRYPTSFVEHAKRNVKDTKQALAACRAELKEARRMVP